MEQELQRSPRYKLTANDVIEIARICHEANRALCVSRGDLSQKPWDEAEDWQKASCVSGVNYHLKNPNASDQDSHDKWMEEKLKAGWKYGPEKNKETKEHPCLLPYHALPENEKIKDSIFRHLVKAYVEAKNKSNRDTVPKEL